MNINKVILDIDNKCYAVEGEGVPFQIISFDNWSDWNSVKDDFGEFIFDCQIDIDENNGKDVYNFQYVNLLEKEDGTLYVGDEWESVEIVFGDLYGE